MANKKRDELTIQQKQAIQLALQGKSWRTIAKTVGVTEKALWEWRQNPLFNSTLSIMAEMIIQETASLFPRYISAGFAKLLEIINDRHYDQRLQYEAARDLVELPLTHIKTLKLLEHNRKENELEENDLNDRKVPV